MVRSGGSFQVDYGFDPWVAGCDQLILISVRLLHYVGATSATRASALVLEASFADLVLQESRLIRLLCVTASVAGYTVAAAYGVAYAWLSTPLYFAALGASLLTLIILLARPARASGVIAVVFLPASARACAAVAHCRRTRARARATRTCITRFVRARRGPQYSWTGASARTCLPGCVPTALSSSPARLSCYSLPSPRACATTP